MARLLPVLVLLAACVAGARAQADPLDGGATPRTEVGRLERDLAALRATLTESKALSATDGRRPALARRILALDPASAPAHEEMALRALLDARWRYRNALRRGLWSPASPNGLTRSVLAARARAREHLRRALAAEPGRASAHRLALRLALDSHDDDALDDAAGTALRARPDDPEARLWAGLAAWHRGDAAAAEAHFRAALDRLPDADRQPLLSPARFVRPDDRSAWDADPAAWADHFWRARDPRRLTAVNERWLEHVARHVEADLRFAPGDGTRGWRTDRGDTFVRYGPPLAEVWALTDDGATDRWVYPGFTLSFTDLFRRGDYRFASSASGEDDATRARSLANTLGERSAPLLAAPLPLLATAFRGPGDQTDLVVAYGLETMPDGPGHARSGTFVLDAASEVVAERLRADVAAHARPGAAGIWTDAVVLTVPPGAASVRVEVEGAMGLGVGTLPLDVPDRSGSGLRLSDLLLAVAAREADDTPPPAGFVRRGALDLQPAAVASFAADAPVELYAEVYGLALEDGRTRFTLDARLEPEDDAGRLRRTVRRLLGRRPPPGVAVRVEAAGAAPADVAHLLLDVDRQPPGRYRLTLAVTDLASGQTASASRSLTLTAPDP